MTWGASGLSAPPPPRPRDPSSISAAASREIAAEHDDVHPARRTERRARRRERDRNQAYRTAEPASIGFGQGYTSGSNACFWCETYMRIRARLVATHDAISQ